MSAEDLFRVEGLSVRPAEPGPDGPLPDIIRGLDFTVGAGEIHAVMGPNGSGKSTLASALMGSPEYEVTAGTITLLGDDVSAWPADERAKAGMFLAFQYPQEIPGVSVIQFLRQALSARKGIDLSVLELRLAAMEWTERLGMDSAFVDRYLNEGFSGGEKKRNEIMQMAILEPQLAILDETDSGLDIDALRIVARGIHAVREQRPADGRRADHPLPATARRGDPRRRPRDDRRADRGVRRDGARRARRRCRLRVVPRHGGRIVTTTAEAVDRLDATALKQRFPLLLKEIDDAPIHYLDSANTSQKPREVIEAMTAFTETSYAPINRSAYRLAADATDAYEGARAKVAGFVNARHADEIVFTKNATEALNLVAQSWGGAHLTAGDVVVVTEMEHHANVVPWHIMAARQGIELRWLPITPDGQLDLDDGNLERLLDGAKVFAFTAMSNVLGTLTPVAELTAAAHAAGALAVVDACQYVPHNVTDVQAWGADFVAFSAHKMCGPSGIGALWGRAELLDDTPPFLGGGNMIADVRFDGYTPAPVPAKFEAGTPPIIEAIGFGAAVDFMQGVGMERIHAHERALSEYAMTTMTDRFGDDITIHGPANPALRGGVLSFAFRELHPHDVSQVLDQRNVCVRAGHHCAKPLMRVLDVAATVRASWYLYNDRDDIDALADALDGASDIFGLPPAPA